MTYMCNWIPSYKWLKTFLAVVSVAASDKVDRMFEPRPEGFDILELGKWVKHLGPKNGKGYNVATFWKINSKCLIHSDIWWKAGSALEGQELSETYEIMFRCAWANMRDTWGIHDACRETCSCFMQSHSPSDIGCNSRSHFNGYTHPSQRDMKCLAPQMTIPNDYIIVEVRSDQLRYDI